MQLIEIQLASCSQGTKQTSPLNRSIYAQQIPMKVGASTGKSIVGIHQHLILPQHDP
jgi:hypothetical protein